jgi:hypothetical protein
MTTPSPAGSPRETFQRPDALSGRAAALKTGPQPVLAEMTYCALGLSLHQPLGPAEEISHEPDERRVCRTKETCNLMCVQQVVIVRYWDDPSQDASVLQWWTGKKVSYRSGAKVQHIQLELLLLLPAECCHDLQARLNPGLLVSLAEDDDVGDPSESHYRFLLLFSLIRDNDG